MREKILIKIAWALPKSLVYWCAVRLMVYATQGKYENQVVPALLAIDALRRWNEKDGTFWNPYNKVVQSHRDGTINDERTNAERSMRGLPTPWSSELADTEVRQAPVF